MITALIFLPIFVGLSAALTVVAADILTPANVSAASAGKKSDQKQHVTA